MAAEWRKEERVETPLQGEERLEYLEARLDDLKLNKDAYWWYLDLRRYGSGQMSSPLSLFSYLNHIVYKTKNIFKTIDRPFFC